jgi:molybdopterin molybdotransferase
MTDLLSVQEALERMLKRFLPVSTTTVPLELSLGMILAEDIVSTIDQPPFTNSGMDGFAVKAADTSGASAAQPVRLAVIMDIPAGTVAPGPIGPGQAARIMTGAAVPEGADAIVPIEDTNLARNATSAPAPSEIKVLRPAKDGAYLRPQGQDLHSGELLLKTGRRLLPQDLGMLASMGHVCVPVFRQPRLALLSSGDELVSPSEALPPGKIRDTNSYTLGALAEQVGAEVIRLGVVKDDPELIQERLELAIERSADLILTSAGVSVGAFDYVRQVIEQNGELTFWRVNMRPGKPVAFGSFHNIPLIGLPGNPVSAYVGFQVFVRPVLQRLRGMTDLTRPRIKVVLDQAIESDGRESYLRAILFEKCGKITATLAGHQGSGNLYSIIKANALLIIPAGVTTLPAGADLDAWLLDEYWLNYEKA